MGKKLTIIIAILIYGFSLRSQEIKRQLVNANVLQFHHNLYVYGYQQNNVELKFKCYSYTQKLKAIDSTEYNLGKHTPSDYLEISVDTLHDFLNFYFSFLTRIFFLEEYYYC